MKAPKPLASHTVVRLTRTHRKPSEWIGRTNTGHMYAVATARKINVAIADTLNDAIRDVRNSNGYTMKHNSWNSEVSTDDFVDAAGFKLSCEPRETLAGEIL